jgi:hypothetical protein
MAGGLVAASSRPEVTSAWQLTTPMVPASRSQPIILVTARDIEPSPSFRYRTVEVQAKMWGASEVLRNGGRCGAAPEEAATPIPRDRRRDARYVCVSMS